MKKVSLKVGMTLSNTIVNIAQYLHNLSFTEWKRERKGTLESI